MLSIETFLDLEHEATAWRLHVRGNPELDCRVSKAAKFATEKLASFGIDHIENGTVETGRRSDPGQGRKGTHDRVEAGDGRFANN